MLALFDDDEDGEISIIESENVQNVNCSNRSISDLTGLEVCPNLKYLNFNSNNVSIVNLPNLAKLETIVAYGNPIDRLVVNNDTALTALYLQDVNTNALSDVELTIDGYDQAETLYLAFAGTKYNRLCLVHSDVLTSYDISENIQLVKLRAYGNSKITGVDVSTLTSLVFLSIGNCALTALDVSTNTALTQLYCHNNKLTSLNVDNNRELVILRCEGNQLPTLRITNNTLLEKVNVADNQLLNLNVRQNTVLTSLNVSGNAGITALALGYNAALDTLEAANTGLTDIDLSANLAIKKLNLSGCSDMHIIDLAVNTALVNLNVSSTSLATLDVSNNTSLATLDVSKVVKLIVSTGLKSSIYKIGQYVSIDGVTGVIYSTSSKKIVSVDEASNTWDYFGTTTGATSASDGAANTDKIAAKSNAAKWCRAKGSAWYLPARDELYVVYNNKAKLNTTLSSIGGTQLGTGYYWSSTECDNYYAYRVNFSSGSTSSYDCKDYSCTVRAVRAL